MMQMKRKFVDPLVVPVAMFAVTAFLIIGIGKTVLAIHQPGVKDRFGRPELWVALGVAMFVIAACGFLATRPHKGKRIEAPLVIGSTPMFEKDSFTPRPVPADARVGARGTVSQVGDGYTLYALSGPVAQVIDTLPGGVDRGKRFAGYLHARGIGGASNEMWVPFEAVTEVYPDAGTAFLSIRGDEIESFGWTSPPSASK